jgi:hypothetical protein
MDLSTVQSGEKQFLELERMNDKVMQEDYAASIVIPEGLTGELLLSSKFGSDSFRFLYTDESAHHLRRVGDSQASFLAGARAIHHLNSGIWNFWAYNVSRGRFEKIISKYYPSGRKTGTFLLGATTRISAEKKTCVVYEIRLIQQIKDACLSDLNLNLGINN